ncbi:hypothetical protein N7520_006751 [Penicillium odoratum]|uniref:uncharacterized protein n=1 Tax=Penicillium odoratum TaxID=1167516 RepID=UPI002547864B|nr:uncharacterized protein N7520_006751 [Penicillium odoratum]KAJ5759595.1 hypothetical protein N7520_006751 [Penicillium odoratum]
MGNECQVYSEREELVVYKCRNMYHHLRDISDLVDGSHSDTMGLKFDYGLTEDEGDSFLSNQPLELDIIESLQKKADSLTHEEFNIQSPSEGAVTIPSNPASVALKPDLQYIIHIAFPHKQHGIEVMLIAQAFTAVVVENPPQGKTISFEFFSTDQSLPAILASHRDLINFQPGLAIGALHQGSRTFPQARHHYDVEVPSDRAPYRIFFVIIDRPDFLTGPGVLFFLADGSEMTDEAQKVCIDAGLSGYKRGGHASYQVWRRAGMTEVAQRLAMISKLQESETEEIEYIY